MILSPGSAFTEPHILAKGDLMKKAVALLAPAVLTALCLAAPPAHAAPVPVGEEVFIDHVQTGEHITPNGFSPTPTGIVDIWEDHDDVILDSEKWVYERVATNTYVISNAGDGDACLHPSSVESRRLIATKACRHSNKQQWWMLYPTDTGVVDGFTLRPYIDTTLAITPDAVPSHNDQPLVLSPAGDYLNQVFHNRIA
ncbi:hypothetical protein LHJ74_07240 [Streptomyces sp. N2-109]|uniref:Ricin B lectin domain-containing protein n=1 Tax=Streptomyces gossypii TaxID=2883101 RepID=A0ABT2JPC0_9ACTN|nr:hypothetical protein [Streptomyces gossypii]MCT2589715.1 hypothetical protein [Streptomyces gossypii]